MRCRIVIKQRLALEEFVTFVHRPENVERRFELIDGELVEMSPGRSGYSRISARIISKVQIYCDDNGLPCEISGEGGAYNIAGHVVAPDFAYKDSPVDINGLEPPASRSEPWFDFNGGG